MTKQQIIQDFIDKNRLPAGTCKNTMLYSKLQVTNQDLTLSTSFYLEGVNGCGKTFFANSFIANWICQEFSEGFNNYKKYKDIPSYIKMSRLENQIKEYLGFDEDKKYGAKLVINELKEAKLLVIDDFWVSFGTPNFLSGLRQVLFDIFEYRFENKLQTILTTNEDLDFLIETNAEYKRILSRFLGIKTQVKLENKIDLRQQINYIEAQIKECIKNIELENNKLQLTEQQQIDGFWNCIKPFAKLGSWQKILDFLENYDTDLKFGSYKFAINIFKKLPETTQKKILEQIKTKL